MKSNILKEIIIEFIFCVGVVFGTAGLLFLFYYA